MNDKEYLMAAIDWVCAMCRDHGLKYRRSDFRTDGSFLCDCSNVAHIPETRFSPSSVLSHTAENHTS